MNDILQLLNAVVHAFGRTTSLILIAAVFGFAIWSKWYGARQARRGFEEALAEKERSIQRLAEENRNWRVMFGIETLGLSRQNSEKVFTRNEFTTPLEARKKLEQPPKKKRQRKQNPGGPSRKKRG